MAEFAGFKKNQKSLGDNFYVLFFAVLGTTLRSLDVLQKEGFIQEYTVSKDKSFETIEINLKYMYGDPVIKEIERVSRPGRRIYSRSDSIQKIQNGLGISIISTSKGIFSDNEAREKKLGGEVLCKVS